MTGRLRSRLEARPNPHRGGAPHRSGARPSSPADNASCGPPQASDGLRVPCGGRNVSRPTIAAIASHFVYYPAAYVGFYIPTVYVFRAGFYTLLVELCLATVLFSVLQYLAAARSSWGRVVLRAIGVSASTAACYLILVLIAAPGHKKGWPVDGAPTQLIMMVVGVFAVSAISQALGRAGKTSTGPGPHPPTTF